jgi:hypothetical protein
VIRRISTRALNPPKPLRLMMEVSLLPMSLSNTQNATKTQMVEEFFGTPDNYMRKYAKKTHGRHSNEFLDTSDLNQLFLNCLNHIFQRQVISVRYSDGALQ